MADAGLITLADVEENNFVVDNNSLFNFLKKEDMKGKPLVIISISGVSRSGKSFIMNFFLRYLRNQGWKNKKWLGDDSTAITRDFPSKRGEDACTQGITVWSEVFGVPLKDGREACVILVDTQGLFDMNTPPERNMKLMSLSTLFSSHQILNLMQKIDERDIDHLKLCIECAKAAGSVGSKIKPFQSLTFLVRDWQSNENFGDNLNGYLKRFFGKTSESQEVQILKDSIPDAFDNVGCTVLPEPGKAVKRAKEGQILTNKDVDDEFLKHTEDFVNRLLDPNSLVVKRGKDGREETTTGLLNLLSAVSNAFKAGQIPTAVTIMQSLARSNNAKALSESVAVYKSSMKQTCQRIMDETALMSNDAAALDLATRRLQRLASTFDEASMTDCLEQMKQECGDAFESFDRENDDRKAKKRLEFRDVITECAAKYTDKIKQVGPDVDEDTFDAKHQEYCHKAVSTFENATKDFAQMMPEISYLRAELDESIESCHTYVKGTWKDKKLAQDSTKQRLPTTSMDKLVRKFEQELNEYGQNYEEKLDDILDKLKTRYMEKYKKKMASTDPKDVEVLRNKLDELANRTSKANRNRKARDTVEYRNLGRRYAQMFEDKLHETMDTASLRESIIQKSHAEFETKLKADEMYKKLPEWGKIVAREPLQESCDRLKEQNRRNRGHRNTEISNWEKFRETLLYYFRKLFSKKVD